jgi:sugar lactone lactonase YvrE
MLRNDWNISWIRRAAWLTLLLLGVAAIGLNAFGTTPPVSVSKLTTITASGLSLPGKVVEDTCGNLYEIEAGGELMEVPVSGSAAVDLGENLGGYANQALAIDSSNNLYITAPGYAGNMLKIPSTSCVPDISAASHTAQFPSWYFAEGAVLDASGNLFIIGSNNGIMEQSASGTLSTLLYASCLPTAIAVDAKDNLYFTCNTSGIVYQIAYASKAYASSATEYISSNLTTADGLTFDTSGNLYITDTSTGILYEVPYSVDAASLVPADIYPISSNPEVGQSLSTAIDGKTILFAPPFYTGTDIYELIPGALDFGSVAVGSKGSAVLDLLFSTSVTPASISVVTASGVFTNTSAGSCYTTTYAANSGCTVNLTFAPSTPGLARGSVVLSDSSGAALATADISGIGTGAGLTVDPGAVSSLGSGYSAPTGMAIDNQGDLFLADSSKNVVWEIPVGSTTPVSLGSKLSGPTGVAVDGAGNLYIADTGNNQIVEVPMVNGALSTTAQETLISSSTALASSDLSKPAGITIDTLGNLYIADAGNSRVVYVPYVGSWDLSLALSLGSGLSSPSATAVDASGNLYVADSGSGKVYEISAPFSAGTQTTIASGYKTPTALALDASGALFVVDEGDAEVWRIPSISGVLTSSSAVNVTGQVNSSGTAVIAAPYGIALDPIGNLYVSDSTNAAAYEVNRISSTQPFGTWTPGTTSGKLVYFLENSGNSALTFGSPAYTTSGNTTDFNLFSSETGACASGATVAAGSSCDFEATFSPTVDGTYTETATLSSNATNASGQQVVFTGTGAITTATTSTLSVTSPSGSPSYDEAITLSVTVAASSGTPVGAVNLVVDSITKQTATLSNGTATFTLSGGTLSGGSHTLSAVYEGGVSGYVTYSQSTSSSLTINVTRAPTVSSVAFSTLYSNPNSQPAGTAIGFTATVTSSDSGTLSGTVAFHFVYSNGTEATEAATSYTASGSSLLATLSYAPVDASGTGFEVITVYAVYSGDTNFSGSTSVSQSFKVSPATGSVVSTEGGSSITSSSSGSTNITFTATSYGGWTGVVGYHCVSSTLPANAICVFSPGQLLITPSTSSKTYPAFTTQLKIVVNNPPNSPAQSSMPWWLAGLLGVGLLVKRRQLARSGAWGTMVLLIAAVVSLTALGTMSACSSGVSFVTLTGSSIVTVIADSDPYVSGSTTDTQACGTTAYSSASTYLPCTQQSFDVSLTVQ